jgi:hypothetical protein
MNQQENLPAINIDLDGECTFMTAKSSMPPTGYGNIYLLQLREWRVG